jgi:hypothetical protein
MRQIDLKEFREWKSRYAIRNDGEEGAFISSASYLFPSGEVKTKWDESAKDLSWEQVIPDSSAEGLWIYIKAHNELEKVMKKQKK